jgi:serine protease Do
MKHHRLFLSVLAACVVIAFSAQGAQAQQGGPQVGGSSAAASPEATPAERRPLDFEQIIETAKDRVFPALVYVKPICETFEDGERERAQVFGSGVIISGDGLVVTNHHVVDKAIAINCVLWNKEQVPAKLVGQDQETDLAVIRLEWKGKEPLPTAEFADSDQLTEGQFVMALGAPFGFTRSISLGIISNTQRYIGFRTIYKYNLWLQTDASVNPGNSGGPLVDTKGRVVGINTLGAGGGEMGFSIPANEVKRIVACLCKDGKVVRAWTGIELQALRDFDSDTFIEGDEGVLIKTIEAESPAKSAGLMGGDILLSVNGAPVNGKYVEQIPGIRWMLSGLPVGQPVTATVRRAGQTLDITLTPVLKGELEGKDFDCRRWNMTVKDITQQANPTLYFYVKEGVFIRAVRYPGNAETADLRSNDILLKLDNEPVKTVDDVKRVYERLMADEKREKKVLVTVMREGLERMVVMDYRRDYEKED